MKTKILVAGLACLTVFAVAQQSEKKTDPAASHEVKSPRDLATGQASGRKADHTAASDASAGTARETGSGMATGKITTVSGDPHEMSVSTGDTNGDSTMVRESPSKASLRLRESPTKASTGKTSVAAGDVDGDGKADKTATSDGVKSPRDVATGQASGKRQHAPVKITKEVESSAPQK